MAVFRRLVSRENRRFQEDGIDLDLSYITPRIIAMGFPSTGIEGVYRNPASAVAAFLDARHHGNFRIYNLTERLYDHNAFNGTVECFPWPDHHAPPFALLVDLMRSMHDWYHENQKNVLVVHCLAGHGRTGTAICAFLLFEGMYATPDEALDEFAVKRSKTKRGVGHPSQCRAVNYAYQHIAACAAAGIDKFAPLVSKAARIEYIRFESVFAKESKEKFQIVVFDGKFDPVMNSAWLSSPVAVSSERIEIYAKIQLRGDFTVKLFLVTKKEAPKELARYTASLDFISGLTISVARNELDGPHKDHTCSVFDAQMSLTIALTHDT